MSTITAKIQIYVPRADAENLKITAITYRRTCNWLSEKVFHTKELNQSKTFTTMRFVKLSV